MQARSLSEVFLIFGASTPVCGASLVNCRNVDRFRTAPACRLSGAGPIRRSREAIAGSLNCSRIERCRCVAAVENRYAQGRVHPSSSQRSWLPPACPNVGMVRPEARFAAGTKRSAHKGQNANSRSLRYGASLLSNSGQSRLARMDFGSVLTRQDRSHPRASDCPPRDDGPHQPTRPLTPRLGNLQG